MVNSSRDICLKMDVVLYSGMDYGILWNGILWNGAKTSGRFVPLMHEPGSPNRSFCGYRYSILPESPIMTRSSIVMSLFRRFPRS